MMPVVWFIINQNSILCYLLLFKRSNIVWNIGFIQQTIVLPSGLINSNYFCFQVLLKQTYYSNLYVKHSGIAKTSIAVKTQVKLKQSPLVT